MASRAQRRSSHRLLAAKALPGRTIQGLVLRDDQLTFTCVCKGWTIITTADQVDEEFLRHVRKAKGIEPDLTAPDTALPQVRV